MSNSKDFIYNTFLSAYDTVAIVNILDGQLRFIKNTIHEIPKNRLMHVHDFYEKCLPREQIHPDDLYMFEVYFSKEMLDKYISTKYGGMLFAYRAKHGSSYHWASISLYVPDDDLENQLLICRKRINKDNADMLESLDSRNRNIYKIIKCNLSNGSFRIVRQRESENYIRSKYIKNEYKLHEEWLIESGLIHKDDTTRFKHFTDHSYITEYFEAGNDELSFFYRRKIGGFFKWVRLFIVKSTEYSDTNRVYTYTIEDVDSLLTRLLDNGGYKKQTATHSSTEVYYENLNQALSYITQKYIDFYMIDLKKDLYIIYKFNPETVSGDTPFVGSYSEMSRNYVATKMNKDQEEKLMQFATPDAFKKMLKDKISIEFTFTHTNGQLVKTICTKIESENGMPTKVICMTVPFSTEKLLKIKTFGNFDVFKENGDRVYFNHKQAKELLAYLIDKQGYPVSTKDIVIDILERDPSDKTAIKYVSALAGYAIKTLSEAGYDNIIIKEWNSLRVDTDKLDCDLYNLLGGNASYFHLYHNEYMKEYSWAEETNAEILHYTNK